MDERLRTLIAEILDMRVSDVVPDLHRAETTQWDSLNHLRLMTAFEAEFGVQLTVQEIVDIQSPRHLQQLIQRSGAANA